jgi:hypothetical protein
MTPMVDRTRLKDAEFCMDEDAIEFLDYVSAKLPEHMKSELRFKVFDVEPEDRFIYLMLVHRVHAAIVKYEPNTPMGKSDTVSEIENIYNGWQRNA